jgi:predicted AlkP superfamily phosphohydrolase/phosphomutase
MGSRRPVLAIGIDAAEATQVRSLAADGSLPNLGALGREGAWLDLSAHADLSSAAVWPTFLTGTPPDVHGLYCDWLWDPERMGVRVWEPCVPFWARLGSGPRVGAFDVPLAAPSGTATAFEICGWGPRLPADRLEAISPESAAAIVRAHERHPFGSRSGLSPEPSNRRGGARLAKACLVGVRRRGELARALIAATRPDLTVLVFSEVHEAGHALWHTTEPRSPLFSDLGPSREPVAGGLAALLREVDVEIGRLVEVVGPDAAVAVFALDGMGPSRGVPQFLDPLLRERQWAAAPAPGPSGLSSLPHRVLGFGKRRSPMLLRRAYHGFVPESLVWRVAERTALGPKDWSRTRAFALPTNQHGWIRVNLRGREREGIVEPGDYDRVLDELIAELGELRTEDGRPLVRRILRTANGGGPPPLLPDLTLHWTDAAYDRPVRIADTSVEAIPRDLELTGTHRLDGFCVARGLPVDGGPLLAEKLPELLISATAA